MDRLCRGPAVCAMVSRGSGGARHETRGHGSLCFGPAMPWRGKGRGENGSVLERAVEWLHTGREGVGCRVWEWRCGRHSGGGCRAVDRQRVMAATGPKTRVSRKGVCRGVRDRGCARVLMCRRVQGGRRRGHGGRAPRGPAGARPRAGARATGSNPPGAAAGWRRPVLKGKTRHVHMQKYLHVLCSRVSGTRKGSLDFG